MRARTHTTLTNLFGAALIAATCVACSERTDDRIEREGANAVDATGNAADATGNAIAEGGRAADAAVQMVDVKAALILDNRVDSGNINVDSNHETRTIILKGHVPSAEQKTIAGQIAVAKAVGYQVRNELTIAGR